MAFVTPMERVLSDNMWHIREMILKYVIYQPDGSHLSIQDVRSCRLVRKAWLQSIASLFHKARTPLFQFKLDNAEVVSTNRRHKGRLPKFIKTVASSSLTGIRAPPFGIKIWEAFSISNWEKNLIKSLPNCKSSLTSLSIYYPKYSTPSLFAHLSQKPGIFENLHTLQMTFGVSLASTSTRHGKPQTCSLSAVLQSVLESTKSLKELQISLRFNQLPDRSSGFETLVLPSTLTKIDISCSVDTTDLHMLLNSPLPNLQDLKLVIENRFWDEDLVFKIMEHVKSTVKKLQINSVGPLTGAQIYYLRNFRAESPTFLLKVPVMKTLETLSFPILNIPLLLETVDRYGPEKMPNLKSLTVIGKKFKISEVHVQKWKTQGKVLAVSTS